MLSRDDRNRSGRLAKILLITLLLVSEEALARESDGPSAAMAGVPAAVERAVAGAVAKLSNPACREVFSDFRDAQGRTLQQNLDALGQSPNGYLDLAVFYEGTGGRACAPRSIVAWTNPGSRAIFVCTSQFEAVERHDPGLAAAFIIHEELHSLGLGEGPPDSRVITAQVIARCGK